MMRRIPWVGFLIVGLVIAPGVSAQTSLAISGVSAASNAAKYEKLEINFDINGSGATNKYWPCETQTLGLPSGVGISVDAVLTAPSGKIVRQPGFWYVPYSYVNMGGNDWLYPSSPGRWQVRFAPGETGTWQYHLEAKDGANCQNTARYPQTGESSFTVGPANGNHGFLRVSQSDKRYFEFSDGSPFWGMGHEWNADGGIADWISQMAKFKTYGVNFLRIWFDSSLVWSRGIHGWDAWRGADGKRSTAAKYGGHDFSVALTGNNTYIFETSDGNQAITGALEANKTYKVRVRAKLSNVVPSTTGTGPKGLVVKLLLDPGSWTSGVANLNPGWTGNDNDFQVYESTFTNTLGRVILGYGSALAVGLQNVAGGTAYIDEIYIGEDMGTVGLAPNVVFKGEMNYHWNFDPLASAKWDRILDSASQNGVYLKLVATDIRDGILHCIDRNTGVFITVEANCDDYNFMRGGTKAAKLQEYYWRYLIARWGYSTAVQSWELTNEGPPFDADHEDNSDRMGAYFSANDPNGHLVTTSYWHSLTDDYFNSTTKRIDYGDFHAYQLSTWLTASDAVDPVTKTACGSNQSCYINRISGDTALWHGEHSLVARARVPSLPLVRGETGLGSSWTNDNPVLGNDTKGVWLHDFLWSQVNSGGVYDLYWWTENIVSKPGPDGNSSNGLYDIYRPFSDFMNNIPLNNGKYQDAKTTGTNNGLVYGQKDIINKRAHLWVRNRKHNWCGVVGGVSGCGNTWDNSRLSGTVGVGGFAPGSNLAVEWWMFDGGGVLTKQTTNVLSDGSGQISLSLDNLPANITDTGIKIGNYGAKSGDANGDGKVDGLDYVIWLTNYGTSGGGITKGDFNGDGKVDGLDYVAWLTNYGS